MKRRTPISFPIFVLYWTYRFKLQSGQVSQWLGQPINPALANHEELDVENDQEFVVGFHGIKDSIRLSSIGLKVRSIYKVSLHRQGFREHTLISRTYAYFFYLHVTWCPHVSDA